MWYPGGSLKGDERSKALVESWRDNTMMLKDQYKASLVCIHLYHVRAQMDSCMRVLAWCVCVCVCVCVCADGVRVCDPQDGGMAKSIFDDKPRFVQSLVKM